MKYELPILPSFWWGGCPSMGRWDASLSARWLWNRASVLKLLLYQFSGLFWSQYFVFFLLWCEFPSSIWHNMQKYLRQFSINSMSLFPHCVTTRSVIRPIRHWVRSAGSDTPSFLTFLSSVMQPASSAPITHLCSPPLFLKRALESFHLILQ